MTFIPNAEHIILELKQSFYGEPLKTVERRRYNNRNLSLEKQVQLFTDGIEEIFISLNLDADARTDARQNLVNLAQASYPVEHQTMTFRASQRQILWEFLTHMYIPGVARLAAFWTIDSRADIGMPEDVFWYLPTLDLQSGKLTLPIPQVLDWLLDLFGKSGFALATEIDESPDDKVDSVGRKIRRWREGAFKPKRANVKNNIKDSIDELFADESHLNFKNTFLLDDAQDLQAQLQQVIDFLQSKEGSLPLSAKKLSLEFDRGGEHRIQEVLTGNGSKPYTLFLIDRVARRYATPTPRVIRQRLKFARAIQDGYIRLTKFLCPGIALDCADPNENRVVELVEIFKRIYNLTVEAHSKQGDAGIAEEETYFQNSLPAHLRGTIYRSIAPHDFLQGDADHSVIAEILNKRFSKMDEGSNLTKYLAESKKELEEIELREQDILSEFAIEADEILNLQEGKANSLTVDKISQDKRLWLLFKIAGDDFLNMDHRTAAADQMRRLTVESCMEGLALWLQISLARFQGQQERVEIFLKEADLLRTDPKFAIWDAPIFLTEARHLLSKSNFDEAIKVYDRAWNASKSQPFGSLRGEIAKELLITKTQQNKFNKNNDRSLMRDMTYFGTSNGGSYKADALKQELRPYWDEIYRPYR